MVDPGRLAENVRRAAGAHLVSLDALARHVGITRGGLMKLVAEGGTKRTALPTTATLMKLAEAFALDPRVLMTDEPSELLGEIAANFDNAPIRAVAKVPDPEISRPVGSKVTPIKAKRTRRAGRAR
jgi:transcriptional regulator with XRE-family HTH domain